MCTHIMKKTHKGEEEVEANGEEDLSSLSATKVCYSPVGGGGVAGGYWGCEPTS